MRNDQLEEQEIMVRQSLSKIKNKILVISGKGGVGKTNVAVCLGIHLAKKGHKTGILDVDIHGPSIPRMLGIGGPLDMAPSEQLIPKAVAKNLSAISIEYLLADKNQAVIWRGPLKHSAIAQFIGQVAWGNLDYLVIDSPPGTGDEPLSVAQLIPAAKAVIVTQPQEVSLADVRKCITFCHQVEMEVIGIVENMSGLICPHCGNKIYIFKSGGGEKTALSTGVPFLGSLIFDPDIVYAADEGKLSSYMDDEKRTYNQDFKKIVENITKRLEETAFKPVSIDEIRKSKSIKIAIPLSKEKVAPLFKADRIAIYQVRDGNINYLDTIKQEGHIGPSEIKRIPMVKLVIAKDIKEKANYVLNRDKIGVISNAPDLPAEKLIKEFLAGRL